MSTSTLATGARLSSTDTFTSDDALDLDGDVGSQADIDTLIETSPLFKNDRLIDAAIQRVAADVALAVEICTTEFLLKHPHSAAALLVAAEARDGDLREKIRNEIGADHSLDILVAVMLEKDARPRLREMVGRVRALLAVRLCEVAISLGMSEKMLTNRLATA
ncbi:MAG: hypothetical protein KBC95_00705 [Candidatus Peribacteraceae bacterium]|nr:hypothetical protein [Candidatus Peribacteraceae bacterium]